MVGKNRWVHWSSQLTLQRKQQQIFISCALDRRSSFIGLPKMFVGRILTSCSLNQISHQSHLSIIWHLLKILFFFCSFCFLSHFSSWSNFCPTGDIQKYKGVKESTYHISGSMFLLSYGYCDLTFVCVSVNIYRWKSWSFLPLLWFHAIWVCRFLVWSKVDIYLSWL